MTEQEVMDILTEEDLTKITRFGMEWKFDEAKKIIIDRIVEKYGYKMYSSVLGKVRANRIAKTICQKALEAAILVTKMMKEQEDVKKSL